MTHRYLDFPQAIERKLLSELWETLPIVETDEDPLEEIQRWVEAYRADRRKELFERLLKVYGWKRFQLNVFGKMEVFIGTQAEFYALNREYERDRISKQIPEPTPVTLTLLELTDRMARDLFSDKDEEDIKKLALALHDSVFDDEYEHAIVQYAEVLLQHKITGTKDAFILERKQ